MIRPLVRLPKAEVYQIAIAQSKHSLSLAQLRLYHGGCTELVGMQLCFHLCCLPIFFLHLTQVCKSQIELPNCSSASTCSRCAGVLFPTYGFQEIEVFCRIILQEDAVSLISSIL